LHQISSAAYIHRRRGARRSGNTGQCARVPGTCDQIVAGDSAGGNFTLALMLRLRDEGLPLPAGAVALSAVADLTFGSESVRRNDGVYDIYPTRRSLHPRSLVGTGHVSWRRVGRGRGCTRCQRGTNPGLQASPSRRLNVMGPAVPGDHASASVARGRWWVGRGSEVDGWAWRSPEG